MHGELVILKQDCECEQILQNRSRQSSLAALTTPGSRAQDFGADRCRRSAPRTGLQTRRECFGRCSIERSTPAADDRAARGGGGSRHRGHAFCGARQEVGAGRGNGERGALCGGLKGQRGASAHAEHANFARRAWTKRALGARLAAHFSCTLGLFLCALCTSGSHWDSSCLRFAAAFLAQIRFIKVPHLLSRVCSLEVRLEA